MPTSRKKRPPVRCRLSLSLDSTPMSLGRENDPRRGSVRLRCPCTWPSGTESDPPHPALSVSKALHAGDERFRLNSEFRPARKQGRYLCAMHDVLAGQASVLGQESPMSPRSTTAVCSPAFANCQAVYLPPSPLLSTKLSKCSVSGTMRLDRRQ